MKTRFSEALSRSKRKQQGAALFLALMMLIIVSLLAVSASQVTALQERMVQAYWSDIRAFEGAEERLRSAEKELRAQAIAEECPILEFPDQLPAWAIRAAPAAAATHVDNLSDNQSARGSGVGGSLEVAGRDASQCMFFLVSATDSDTRIDDDANAWSVVQSVFTP